MTDVRRVVVAGASRGVGLELVRQMVERGDVVAALARRPEASHELARLASRHADRLSLHACDVTDDNAVRTATGELGARLAAVDVLWNVAGVSGDRESGIAGLDWGDLHAVFDVNTLGPLRVTRALLPLLRESGASFVVNVTSKMGSIGLNEGGWWPYRISKAALNMATSNLAAELGPDGVTCVVVHPGWVRTDMGGPDAPLGVEQSARELLAVADGLTPADAGRFLDRDGAPIPW